MLILPLSLSQAQHETETGLVLKKLISIIPYCGRWIFIVQILIYVCLLDMMKTTPSIQNKKND